MTETLEYSDAKEEYLGLMTDGKLRIHDKGITFRNARTGKSVTIVATELDTAQWVRLGAAYGIRLLLKNGNFHRFGGLKESENETVKVYFKEKFDVELENVDYSTRGWNWGEAEFTGSVLPFKVRDKAAFDIPLGYVSSSVYNKNEVTIGFHQNDFKFYPTFLHLHGKTYDFKIPYTTVIRIFMLPDPKHKIYYLVVSLDPPVKHGQTRYHFLIMSFDRDEETTVDLQISDEDIQSKYAGKLEKEMSGTECVIFAKLLKVLSGRKVISSDSSAFKSHSKAEAVTCNFKAQSGLMYPLDRGFVYVGKPPAHIRFDEIAYVNFARSNTATKSFDLDIETKLGQQLYSFSSIPKEEYTSMYDFMKSKNVRIKNRGLTSDATAAMDDDDDVGGDSGSEGDDDYDPYLARMKKEGKAKDDGDMDSDSEDDDFCPDNIDVSDVADEYDSDVTSTDSEDESDSSDDSTTKTKKRKRREDKKDDRERQRKKIKAHRESGGGGRKKRRSQRGEKKDPLAPKRPQTAYFLFLGDNRESIKADNPDISVTDIAKRAAEMWKEIDPEEKAKYDEKVAEARKKYEVAMKEYKASGGSGKSSSSPKHASPSKGGSGGGYKSKEYIEEDDASSDDTTDSEQDEKPLKELKKGKGGKKKKTQSKAENVKKRKEKSDGEGSGSSDAPAEESDAEDEESNSESN